MLQKTSNNLLHLNPTKYPHVFDVSLKLYHQTRFIGKIDSSGAGTFIADPKEHVYCGESNSLGLSLVLLADKSIPFKWIVFDNCGRKLVTSRNFFLAKSRVLGLNDREPQCFLKIELFGIEKARRFEDEHGEQEQYYGKIRRAS